MRSWNIKKQACHQVAALCDALHCSHYFARILINRGYDSPEKAKLFLNIDHTELPDPFLFDGMKTAVERIGTAIQNGERITVYGDYDVDGITSTGLLVEVLRELGGTVDYYIPSRFTEGYGVNSDAVKTIASKGTRLLITVDTGITAVKEVEEAKSLGLDVIITDHHECQAVLPDTLIINPKHSESGYPFADLAGVGVVYKLVCALDQQFGLGVGKERYTSFAAVGTVADIMPMRGENRYIVRKGLESLKETGCIGLRTMIDRCLGDRPIDTSAVGFVIAPRINAAGRMGSASVGVELLTTDDHILAEKLVDDLCKENNRRQEIENKILEEAVAMLENDPSLACRNAIVLWGEDWHNGVVGIVASRLKDRYGKPCILFSVNGDHAKGSGRSVRPFNLFETLERLSSYLEKFGGHAYAAGVLVHTEKLEAFREAFCEEVDRFLEGNDFDESIEVDCVLQDVDLTLDQIKDLDRLAPFGRDNETPVFCMQKVHILDAAPTTNGNHMRLVLQCGHLRVTAFYFNMPPSNFPYQSGDWVDIVFEADINTYNGRQSVQLSLKDVHYAEDKCRWVLDEISRIERGKLTLGDVPARRHTVAVYRYLHKRILKGNSAFDFYSLPERIVHEQQCPDISVGNIYFSLQILRELGVLTYNKTGSVLINVQFHAEKRTNLEDSKILKEITSKVGESAWV
ncbi:MAG: single-stranded-DNA-specific exonuclease RecJ [Clostridia bacterium]|nr:single-stranded-DNA-specific exonuclease RecJ [Clostridia bacterium]